MHVPLTPYHQGINDRISCSRTATNHQQITFSDGAEKEALFERLKKEIIEATSEEVAELRREVAEAMKHINAMKMSDENTNWQANNAQQELYDRPPPTSKVSSQQVQKATVTKNTDGSLDPSSPDNSDKFQTELTSDTYTLMMITKPFHKSWNFGFGIFLIQITLLILIFLSGGFGGATFLSDIPFKVSNEMRASQFIAIFITIMISHDIFMPVKDLTLLWINRREWSKVVQGINTTSYRSMRNFDMEDDGGSWGRPVVKRRKTWLLHIFLPCMLKFLQGIFVLIITFVIVIQSDNTLDLFKDFAGKCPLFILHFVHAYIFLSFCICRSY